MSSAIEASTVKEKEICTWILGDAGYPLQPLLMTPFCSPQEGSREGVFYKAHEMVRNIVEGCIGLLKNRFDCVLGARQLHYSPQKVAQVVNICCALHNICINFHVEKPTTEGQTKVEIPEIAEQVENESYSTEASQIRENIVKTMVKLEPC